MAVPLLVREALPGDLPAMREAFGADVPLPEPGVHLLLWQGELAAWGHVGRPPEPILELEVARSHRGLGLGKVLLAALETRAARTGAVAVRLLAPKDGPWAPSLAKAGWADDGFRGPSVLWRKALP